MSTTREENLLAECAAILRQGLDPEQQPPRSRALLRSLEYDAQDTGPANRHRARLLQAASRFARVFQLRAPDAPGLIFFGAEVDPNAADYRPLPASGAGLSFQSAFEGCIGEGIELLSQFERVGDVSMRTGLAHCDPMLAPLVANLPADTVVDWMISRRPLNESEAAIPADLCLRRGSRHDFLPQWPLSIGCAAGMSREEAMLHGLLELIERDAAALWWRGGLRGRLIALDDETTGRTVDLLTQMRGGTQRRRCWLLDITTDLAVPTVAAISVDRSCGGFACGLAARLTLRLAAEAAVLEMAQMELAHHVVAAKRKESGDAALNQLDRAHLRRATELSISDCVLLHPVLESPMPPLNIQCDDVSLGLRQLLEHLSAKGIETFVVDLTRPDLAIPVVRMVCPQLEREPSVVVGDRLRAAVERTGGGARHTCGVPLM